MSHRREPQRWAGIALIALALLPACGDDETTPGGSTATTTGSDAGADAPAEAPFVTEATPAEGAADVAIDLAEIRVTFSEAMDASAGQGQLDGATLGDPVWEGDTLTFPVSGLAYATAYRLVLEGFASASGEPLDVEPTLGDGALDFTTEEDPAVADTDAPEVLSAIPAEGQADVAIDIGAVVVTFDEPMDTSLGAATLDGGSAPLPLSGSWSADGTEVTFALGAPLEPSTAYALDLSGFADEAGNAVDPQPYLGDGALGFTTAAPIDATAPFAAASSPAEGDAQISPALAAITVDFSEAMDTSITGAPLLIGANSLQLTGVWAAGGTQITFALPSQLAPSVAFALDLTGMQDLAGNALDAAHPYLADGQLDFITLTPTGDSCTNALLLSQSTVVGNARVWSIPAGTVTGVEGQFACDPNTLGPDAVIRYTKTSADLAGGGNLLHVRANTAETSTNYFLNLEIVSGACDAAAGTLQKCLWYKHDWDSYVDVPAGDYYIWVGKNSPATATFPFPATTVTVEEVPPAAAEGEGCFAPYTASSSIYTPPAAAGEPHTWTLPATINSFDMGVTWGEPGSISCDNTPSYGDIHGVDAVIAFDKTSATSVLDVKVQNLAPVLGTSDLNVEVLSVCDPNDPAKISRRCRKDADTFSFTTPSPTGTVYVWVSTEATAEEFEGATVQITEIFPGIGESWSTAEPLLASGGITPTSAKRLDPPSCFPAAGNVHWYAYTLTNSAVAIGTNVPGAIGILDSSGEQIRCSTNALATPIGVLAAPGSTLYIAVETAGPITALNLNDIPYTGLTGALTDLNIAWPSSSIDDNGMAVGATHIYMGGTSKVFAIPKAGNTTALEHGAADGITATHLGYDLALAGGWLFSLDSTTSVNASRLFRIHDEATMVWAPAPWDQSPAYPTSSPSYAMTYDGTSLILATRSTVGKVDFFSVSATMSSVPVALGTNTGVDYVVGIAADSQYLYVAGDGQAGQGEGVFRIPRAAITSPPVQIAKLNTSTTRNSLVVDDYASAQNLYVREYNPSDIHVIVSPGQPNATHLGVISTLGGSADYAMVYDQADDVLYFYESESDSAGRLQRME